ncbi:MAG: sigma-70 family RNA polymerase sigma factor [Clostridia bacterium]|nr:sigma-70 family RNA polymerase sigma factor [Clostridia bacterium]MBQ3461713.1 sigma-70 family RNA polymerase sigma factor [Clostridia bacterium]
MTEINLRKLYPDYYAQDYYIAVSDIIADELLRFDRAENAYRHRVSYHKAYYSLDYGGGIENSILNLPLSPAEFYEQQETIQTIYASVYGLPKIQARRIYSRFYLNMRNADIARNENISASAVSEAIRSGLKKLSVVLKRGEVV